MRAQGHAVESICRPSRSSAECTVARGMKTLGQFKTLKYAPIFPSRFGSLADARASGDVFFSYYNHEHRHSGIGLHTPASVHHGTAAQVREHRAATLHAAYTANPARFRHRQPQPPRLPTAAWINQPSREALIQSA